MRCCKPKEKAKSALPDLESDCSRAPEQVQPLSPAVLAGTPVIRMRREVFIYKKNLC